MIEHIVMGIICLTLILANYEPPEKPKQICIHLSEDTKQFLQQYHQAS